MFDYFRVASVIPKLSLGNVKENCDSIIDFIRTADNDNCDIAVFPELCLTGYTVGDLLLQSTLQNAVKDALGRIAVETALCGVAVAVGAPIVIDSQLYDSAVIIEGGKIRGIVPKTFLSDHGEFCEKRWFAPVESLLRNEICSCELGISEQYNIPVGNDIIFALSGAYVGVEIGGDLFSPLPCSSMLSLAGAEVIINLSAGIKTVGSLECLKSSISAQSQRTISAYIYTSAGRGESTTDTVSDGVCAVCERGSFVKLEADISLEEHIAVADIDLGKIRADRCKNSVFSDARAKALSCCNYRFAVCNNTSARSDGEYIAVRKMPFIPSDKEERIARCKEIFEIQAEGLRRRLLVTGAKPVVGISGGLDSTLAILVAVEAQKRLGRPVSDVIGITMPCFGTTDRTYNNALSLMQLLGITCLEIPIKAACIQHAEDIGQPLDKYDLTYENMQARERTQVLMDYSGRVGGLVVGTGDLSEIALGWCTYNADHMSMYGVNSGVPKTLIRWMVVSLAESEMFGSCKDILLDIADTPISPELLPPDETGNIAQQTEELVGPYSLHDFFIFYAIRYGFEPEKIFHLACKAFDGDYSKEVILKWLRSFYRRFFTQQFKRSCSPDGVKVGSVGLSPRGDWKMPSDATFAMWMEKVDSIEL